MTKFLVFILVLVGSTISAYSSKNIRSITEPLFESTSSSAYGVSTPVWSSNQNPWKNLKITPDLYHSTSHIPKQSPIVVTKEIHVPVEKFIPYPVEKIVHVPIEKIIQVPVERIIQIPVDRIVRVPVQVPAAQSPVQQMIPIASAPMIAPMATAAPITLPIQQQMPLMLRPGIPYSNPIVITAQGLSISTSGLITPAAGTDQMLVQTAAVQPPSPPPLPLVQPAPISNNATVGISFILNSLTPTKLFPQNNGLGYINALPEISPGSIQGNQLSAGNAHGDYSIIESLFQNVGEGRWKRNADDNDDNSNL